ncbi:MAG: hypothetical protein IJ743_02080 [Bacilli bacterium]|nr:hypothetical protein [Bacilli bacterium]MBR1817752.1 hypothetical protein [Bacilli bacterium]
MKNGFNNKKKIMYFSMLGILLLIGVSYAVWQLSFTQASPNVATSACFSLTFEDSNDITLNSAYPLTDEEGRTLTPYTFTITNNCAEYASYQVNLEVLNTTTMDSAYIKSEFNNTVKLVSAYPTTTKTLNNASTAYKLITGYLDPNEEVTYTLKLWIDYNSTTEQSANKIYDSKITIASTYKASAPTSQEECAVEYGEGATICNFIAQADPNNDKCLQVDQNGMILNLDSTMNDSEDPIICTMEDDYGTSYYLRGLHTDNNVKFANVCWKLMRVTGTGGYKLIYNGDLDANGKCTTTSGNHTGFTGQTLNLSGNKVYGTSYTKEGTTYTLSDTSTLNWSTDPSSIIGKYTCGNTSTSCTTLYWVAKEYNSTYGYVLKLNQNINYDQIGQSAFNYNGSRNTQEAGDPSKVGYMYNDSYPFKWIDLHNNTNNIYYGEFFTYNNNSYTLDNTVQLANLNNSQLKTHHYTCFNANDNTCTEMYYIFYDYQSSGDVYYIKLNGNETVSDALDKMLRNSDINVKDSNVKRAIDWWYEQKIKDTEYESYLEDTIFCNDRTIDNLGGWSETGELASYPDLQFNTYNGKYYLKCPSKRDAFTINNSEYGNNALTYPVGLLTAAEYILIGNYTASATGARYWTLSPNFFAYGNLSEMHVDNTGKLDNVGFEMNNRLGIRPVISLKPGTQFVEGTTGTASNPYEVE